jgi:mannitol 2-dehydrogenase
VTALIEEVILTLQSVADIDLNNYEKALIERFENPKIRDQVFRLSLNNSTKNPKFL